MNTVLLRICCLLDKQRPIVGDKETAIIFMSESYFLLRHSGKILSEDIRRPVKSSVWLYMFMESTLSYSLYLGQVCRWSVFAVLLCWSA